MRIGIICPYSFATPGGVQNHILDLAAKLIARNHHVQVLAPEATTGSVPDFVVSAGSGFSVPYNGSVAKLMFGPKAAIRVKKFVNDGNFDVVHVHEPAAPSLSMLAVTESASFSTPLVATFHMATKKSRALSFFSPLLRVRLERIAARIAVSALAQETLKTHLGWESVVIPNGVDIAKIAAGVPRPEWQFQGGTLCFVGRYSEPRKGFPVLAAAFTALAEAQPDLDFGLLVVGGGDETAAQELFPEKLLPRVKFLGMLDDAGKADALASSDVYLAPNTGGESFGIILLEAMAAGACVLAADLPAFVAVLAAGKYGLTFANENSQDLAEKIQYLLNSAEIRAEFVAKAAIGVRRYDWEMVTSELERVYETVIR